MKISFKKLGGKILLFIGLYAFVLLFILTIDGLHDELGVTDLGLVFGNEVTAEGELSARLKARLDKTFELYEQGFFPIIIVSGGIDDNGHNEAEFMKNYLVSKGIPEENVLEDAKGNTTAETVINSLRTMENLDANSIFVISQFYHMARIKLSFWKLSEKEVYSAHANFFEARDLYSMGREFFAFHKYLLFPLNS